MNANRAAVQQLTSDAWHGDAAARTKLFEILCDHMRHELAQTSAPLRPMEHVQHCVATLHGQQAKIPGRLTVYTVAVSAFRRLLFEMTQGREGMREVELEEPSGSACYRTTVAGLDEVLERLGDLNPRHLKVAEMRFFTGLSNENTSAATGVSRSAVKNDWIASKAWIRRELEARSMDAA